MGVAAASIALSQPQLNEKQTAKEDIIELPTDFLFDFDNANIRPGAISTLEKAATILRQQNVSPARIEGHSDSKGQPDYNLHLSQQRAEAVKNWLVDRGGLGNVTFTLRGFGATQPAAPDTNRDGSDNPEGRARNRRVVIAFDKQ